jgi:HPt (histidine-containing phosphotransfer) domain-containing protein
MAVHRPILRCTLILASALAAAACGSSGSSGTAGTSGTSATAPSPAAFEARANSICAAANKTLDAVPKPTSAAEVKRFVDVEFPVIERTTRQLEALTPPATVQAAYHHYLSSLSDELAVLRQAKADADRGDVAGAIRVSNTTGQQIHAQTHAAAQAAHLPGCAK